MLKGGKNGNEFISDNAHCFLAQFVCRAHSKVQPQDFTHWRRGAFPCHSTDPLEHNRVFCSAQAKVSRQIILKPFQKQTELNCVTKDTIQVKVVQFLRVNQNHRTPGVDGFLAIKQNQRDRDKKREREQHLSMQNNNNQYLFIF